MLERIGQAVRRFVARIPANAKLMQGSITQSYFGPGPIEDVTSFTAPDRFVGTSLGMSDVPEVAAITALKQDAAELIRARVIEFKAKVAGTNVLATFTREVRRADAEAFDQLKWDIRAAVEDGSLMSSLQEIIPTLKTRPGYVYITA